MVCVSSVPLILLPSVLTAFRYHALCLIKIHYDPQYKLRSPAQRRLSTGSDLVEEVPWSAGCSHLVGTY